MADRISTKTVCPFPFAFDPAVVKAFEDDGGDIDKLTADNCTKTFAEVLDPVWAIFQGCMLFLFGAVFLPMTLTQLYRVYKFAQKRSISVSGTIQFKLYVVLLAYISFVLIEQVDPFGYRNVMTPLVYFIVDELAASCAILIALLIVDFFGKTAEGSLSAVGMPISVYITFTCLGVMLLLGLEVVCILFDNYYNLINGVKNYCIVGIALLILTYTRRYVRSIVDFLNEQSTYYTTTAPGSRGGGASTYNNTRNNSFEREPVSSSSVGGAIPRKESKNSANNSSGQLYGSSSTHMPRVPPGVPTNSTDNGGNTSGGPADLARLSAAVNAANDDGNRKGNANKKIVYRVGGAGARREKDCLDRLFANWIPDRRADPYERHLRMQNRKPSTGSVGTPPATSNLKLHFNEPKEPWPPESKCCCSCSCELCYNCISSCSGFYSNLCEAITNCSCFTSCCSKKKDHSTGQSVKKKESASEQLQRKYRKLQFVLVFLAIVFLGQGSLLVTSGDYQWAYDVTSKIDVVFAILVKVFYSMVAAIVLHLFPVPRIAKEFNKQYDLTASKTEFNTKEKERENKKDKTEASFVKTTI